MTSCIFCKIIKGEIPATKIYEDKNTYAFLDISPINYGHTLVISKKHYKNIFEIPKKELNKTIETVQKIAKALDKISEGINIVQNNRIAAGQDIAHVHFHIIPRFKNDGFKFTWTNKKYKKGQEEKYIKKIKKFL